MHFLVLAPLGRITFNFWGRVESTGLKGHCPRSGHCGMSVSSSEVSTSRILYVFGFSDSHCDLFIFLYAVIAVF